MLAEPGVRVLTQQIVWAGHAALIARLVKHGGAIARVMDGVCICTGTNVHVLDEGSARDMLEAVEYLSSYSLFTGHQWVQIHQILIGFTARFTSVERGSFWSGKVCLASSSTIVVGHVHHAKNEHGRCVGNLVVDVRLAKSRQVFIFKNLELQLSHLPIR